MRYLTFKIRLRFLLSALLLILIVNIFVSQQNIFLWPLKSFFANSISKTAGAKVNFRHFQGGAFQPLILRKVRIKDARNLIVFESEKVTTNLTLWHLVCDKLKYKNFSKPKTLILDIENARLSSAGKFCFLKSLNGRLEVPLDKKETRDFKFELASLTTGQINRRPVKVSGTFSDKAFSASLDLDHFKISRFDLSTKIDLKGKFFTSGESDIPKLTAELISSGTVLDYEPFEELTAKFDIERDVLKISSLVLGDEYKLSGWCNLSGEREADLVLDIKKADLNKISSLANPKRQDILLGEANGQIKLTGPLTNLKTKGHLDLGEGKMRSLNYRYINVNIEGEGSTLKFVDSKVFREEDVLKLDGTIDLKQLCSSDKKVLDLAFRSETIIWNGWDITKPLESPEIKVKKDIGKDLRITFMGYLNDEQAWDESDLKEELDIEYKLTEEQRVKMRLKKDEEFFSLEHKLKF